jgi:hypothetical protein
LLKSPSKVAFAITMLPPLVVFLLASSCSRVASSAFVTPSATTAFRKPTRVGLQDWVADMIDQELYRQGHMNEFEKEWMQKNRAAVVRPSDAVVELSFEEKANSFREAAKDKRLAARSPQQYCADRCIATGNCDVYEDIFAFSPEEVMQFCTDCVLATDEQESCDIPDAFYDIDLLKP